MPFKLQKRFPIETQYRDKHPVKSLMPCSGPPSADCGYAGQFVGKCRPGDPVTVKAKRNTAGIRICKGLYGCDKGAPMPWYTAVLIDNKVGSAQFACPQNGYYSVMTRPSSQVTASKGRYPASEGEVFDFPEGTFYGNIFRTDLLARDAEKYRDRQTPGLLGGDQNACFSPKWTNGVAQMNDRFCAGTSGCFVHDPLPCYKAPGDRCATNAISGKPFAKCTPIAPGSSETVWDLAITTYLNDPCDLSSHQEKCNPREIVRDDGYEKKPRASKR